MPEPERDDSKFESLLRAEIDGVNERYCNLVKKLLHVLSNSEALLAAAQPKPLAIVEPAKTSEVMEVMEVVEVEEIVQPVESIAVEKKIPQPKQEAVQAVRPKPIEIQQPLTNIQSVGEMTPFQQFIAEADTSKVENKFASQSSMDDLLRDLN